MKQKISLFKTHQILFLASVIMLSSVKHTFSMHITSMGEEKAKHFIVNFDKHKSAIEKLQKIQIAEHNKKKQSLLMLFNEKINEQDGTQCNPLVSDPSGHDFITALSQEAAPILVSSKLFYKMRDERQSDKRSLDILYNDFLDELKNGRTDVGKAGILANRMSFRSKEWVVKQVNEGLTLLIPKKGLTNAEINELEKYNENSNTISDIELKLGLKVNHMETITSTINSTNNMNSNVPSRGGFTYHRWRNHYHWDKIFCKKDDYKNTHFSSHISAIYISGHGSDGNSVAGLSLNDYTGLLTFLDENINLKLLNVTSCYAAGKKNRQVYENCSFPVIVNALNDIPTHSNCPMPNIVTWANDKKIELIPYKDFSIFIKNAKEQEGNYQEIIKPITTTEVNNIPQIKLSNKPFSVMEINKKIYKIGTEDIKQKSLDINDAEVVLLHTNRIPSEIIIPSDKTEAIFSMEHDINRIKQISSCKNFTDTIKLFQLLTDSCEKKLILIDKIVDKKNEKRDVIIFGTDGKSMRVYCKNNNQLLTAEVINKLDMKKNGNDKVEWKPVVEGSDLAKEYQDKLNLVYSTIR